MSDTIKPPLPEPAAEAAMDLCADHQGPVEACQYLPADTRLYTADQMHAYGQACADAAVAAERERCAQWLKWYDGKETRRSEAIRRGDHWDAAIRASKEPL